MPVAPPAAPAPAAAFVPFVAPPPPPHVATAAIPDPWAGSASRPPSQPAPPAAWAAVPGVSPPADAQGVSPAAADVGDAGDDAEDNRPTPVPPTPRRPADAAARAAAPGDLPSEPAAAPIAVGPAADAPPEAAQAAPPAASLATPSMEPEAEEGADRDSAPTIEATPISDPATPRPDAPEPLEEIEPERDSDAGPISFEEIPVHADEAAQASPKRPPPPPPRKLGPVGASPTPPPVAVGSPPPAAPPASAPHPSPITTPPPPPPSGAHPVAVVSGGTPPEPRRQAREPALPPVSPIVPPPPPIRPVTPPPSAGPIDGRKRQRAWWDDLFSEDFIRTLDRLDPAFTKREVDFIDESLGLEKGAVILDLACGMGQHAVELASRGYSVVGYDLSLAMLARAADEAQERGQKLNFLQGDMREMAFEEMFDGIYCWSTSFGYFDDEKNLDVLRRMHRALRPGGMVLLDLTNRDYVISRSPSLVWFEGDGCVCMDEMSVDFFTSRLRVKRTAMFDDGRSKELDYSLRLYALHELGKMFHDSGYKVLDVTGHPAHPGVYFGAESPRVIVLAERA